MSLREVICRRFKIKNGSEEVKDFTTIIADKMPLPIGLPSLDSRFLQTFCNLKWLSLNSTGLQDLSTLPTLPQLLSLELSSNNISIGLDQIPLKYGDSLKTLILSNN